MILRYRSAIDLVTAQEHVAEWHPGCARRTYGTDELAAEERAGGAWLKIEVLDTDITYLFRREGV